jgi:hypothetical protein
MPAFRIFSGKPWDGVMPELSAFFNLQQKNQERDAKAAPMIR